MNNLLPIVWIKIILRSVVLYQSLDLVKFSDWKPWCLENVLFTTYKIDLFVSWFKSEHVFIIADWDTIIFSVSKSQQIPRSAFFVSFVLMSACVSPHRGLPDLFIVISFLPLDNRWCTMLWHVSGLIMRINSKNDIEFINCNYLLRCGL